MVDNHLCIDETDFFSFCTMIANGFIGVFSVFASVCNWKTRV